MTIEVRNTCINKYRPDPEKVIKKVLKKIPQKFIENIICIEIFDDKKEEPLEIQAIQNKEKATIKINMENPDFSGKPFFSIALLNLSFMWALNDYLGKISNTKIEKHNFKVRWLHFGLWTPLVYFVMIFIRFFKIVFKVFIPRKGINR